MNYPESQEILEAVKGVNRILVNCHRGPDSDSVGSALALAKVVRMFDKDVLIVCPSDVPEDLKFLKGSDEIKKIDYSSFKFSEYDLFLSIDSSNYSMMSGSKELEMTTDLPIIVIDHHFSNEGFGKINLIDSKMTSTGELLFHIFQDWEVVITSEIAQSLLTGIIGDTGCFQFQGVEDRTLGVGAELIKLGANKDEIIYNIYRNVGFNEVKIWGKIIENMEIDKEHRFVWSVLPITDYQNIIGIDSAKEDAANLFFPIVRDTDFGIIMEERDDATLSISFRSRSKFDVSEIAKEIGGGGHKAAAGARIEGLPFEEAVEKVLAAARKHAKKNS
jgi:phosphoesterase RecJ-like protein